MAHPSVETLTLHTADGVAIEADVVRGAPDAGALVLCHPHPLYGGTRHDAVVGAVWRAAIESGRGAIRFDFRRAHDQGDAERLDVAAAIEAVAPSRVLLVGYSFGSYVCLRVDHPAVAGWVGIAPIVRDEHAAGCDDRPTVLIAAHHDQFVPLDRLRTVTSAWSSTSLVELPGADHFLAGHHTVVAEHVMAAADRVLGPVSA